MSPPGKKKKSDVPILVFFDFYFYIFGFLMSGLVFWSFFFRRILSIPLVKVQPWEQLELFSGAVWNMPVQR